MQNVGSGAHISMVHIHVFSTVLPGKGAPEAALSIILEILLPTTNLQHRLLHCALNSFLNSFPQGFLDFDTECFQKYGKIWG